MPSEPEITYIRSVVEESASTKGKLLLAIQMDEERKSNLYLPTTKVIEILRNICMTRNLNINDYEVKSMSGTVLNISEDTTVADLVDPDIRFDLKESAERSRIDSTSSSQSEAKEKVKKLTIKAQGFIDLLQEVSSLTPDKQNLINLLTDWVQLNVYDFLNDPLKIKLEKI